MRWIKEAIEIKKIASAMNKDNRGYRLSHVWDSLLTTPSVSREDTVSDEGH